MNCNKQSNQVPRNTTHKILFNMRKTFWTLVLYQVEPFSYSRETRFYVCIYLYCRRLDSGLSSDYGSCCSIYSLHAVMYTAHGGIFTVQKKVQIFIFLWRTAGCPFHEWYTFRLRPSQVYEGITWDFQEAGNYTHKETKKWSLYKWNLYWNIYLVPLYSLENKVLWSL